MKIKGFKNRNYEMLDRGFACGKFYCSKRLFKRELRKRMIRRYNKEVVGDQDI